VNFPDTFPFSSCDATVPHSEPPLFCCVVSSLAMDHKWDCSLPIKGFSSLGRDWVALVFVKALRSRRGVRLDSFGPHSYQSFPYNVSFFFSRMCPTVNGRQRKGTCTLTFDGRLPLASLPPHRTLFPPTAHVILFFVFPFFATEFFFPVPDTAMRTRSSPTRYLPPPA